MSVIPTINADSMRELATHRKEEIYREETRNLCEIIDNKIKSAANYGLFQCDLPCSTMLRERRSELEEIYTNRGFTITYDSFRQIFIITWEAKQ